MDVHGARPAHAPKQMLFGYVCQIASSTVKLCVINIRNVEDLGHILQHPCIQDTQHGYAFAYLVSTYLCLLGGIHA